jgi:hypothetical protein
MTQYYGKTITHQDIEVADRFALESVLDEYELPLTADFSWGDFSLHGEAELTGEILHESGDYHTVTDFLYRISGHLSEEGKLTLLTVCYGDGPDNASSTFWHVEQGRVARAEPGNLPLPQTPGPAAREYMDEATVRSAENWFENVDIGELAP